MQQQSLGERDMQDYNQISAIAEAWEVAPVDIHIHSSPNTQQKNACQSPRSDSESAMSLSYTLKVLSRDQSFLGTYVPPNKSLQHAHSHPRHAMVVWIPTPATIHVAFPRGRNVLCMVLDDKVKHFSRQEMYRYLDKTLRLTFWGSMSGGLKSQIKV